MLAGPAPALGQWIKLSQGQSFSNVRSFSISPGGDRVVFVHDATVDGAEELWRVPIGGGTPVRLSGLLPSGAQVIDHAITPDVTRVVYVAPQNTFAVHELYSVPIGGGVPVRLNDPPLVAGRNVFNFRVSPDGLRVVYRADQDADEVYELYSVPVAGGTVVKLNDPLVGGGFIDPSFGISPDSGRVIYLADQDVNETYELYSVPITGGSVEKLNGALPVGGDISVFQISPDSTRVVYVGDQQTNDVFELYSVPIAGGVVVKLNPVLAAGGGVGPFRITPDSSQVVYVSIEQIPAVVWELYRVPIDGGTVRNVSGNIVSGGSGVSDFEISPAGNAVVFLAAKSNPNIVELYRARIDSALPSLAIKLNSPINSPDDVREFKISPDNNWVVYRATELSKSKGYRVPLAGGVAEKIWDNVDITLSELFTIAPGSDHVVMQGVGTVTSDAVERLWRTRLNGAADPAAIELIPIAEFATGGNVVEFKLAPDGGVVYLADQDSNSVVELYALPSFSIIFSDGFEP